ncbi:diaminopimelate epimerase [Paenibacillus gansuensis]|uniref:Diaminopimelate epimerase n=1 Tax=Paenibacillus gansuensis TaxID=306542 RepID=A0ABW5P8U7_9BACL
MKQEVDFVKLNPTQNMTILVKTKHPAEEYQRIASRMMSYDSVYAEQVGFIETPSRQEAEAHLQMAGGEFCGNACMALAVYVASGKGLCPEDSMNIVLQTSGTDQLISCRVRVVADQYLCKIAMPVPRKLEQRQITYEGAELDVAIVRYPDFYHLVIEVESFSEEVREKAQALAKLLGVTQGSSLVGVLLYKTESGEMAPLIYVPPVDSMIWERGCGSGTASLGAYLSWKRKGGVEEPVRQPGGTIHVTADWSGGEVTSVWIEGTVGIAAQGQAYIEL